MLHMSYYFLSGASIYFHMCSMFFNVSWLCLFQLCNIFIKTIKEMVEVSSD